MSRTKRVVVLGFVVAVIAVLIGFTAYLTPQETNPAYDAAVTFADAAGKGDEATAYDLLSPQLKDYVRANCPEGRVSACVDGYTPPAWGAMQSVVFRRAAPDMQEGRPTAYDVDLISTYAEGIGFSGVCIYTRMEQDDSGTWRVAAYAGWVSCGDAESRTMAVNPDAPNRVP